MTKSFTFSLLSLIGLLFFQFACSEKEKAPITIYLVRHAEKDLADTTGNPDLTPEGYARANKLVDILSEVNITSIYSSDYKRTIETVRPTSEKFDLDIQYYTSENWEIMLDVMQSNEGKSHLICGHSNNIVPMITYLKGSSPLTELGHAEYDKLFKVTIENGDTHVDMITY